METPPGEEFFKKARILPVCGAGVNRSGIIKDLLQERGYDVMENRGVNNNYITQEDLLNADVIVFASRHEREWFQKNNDLNSLALSRGIKMLELNVTQSDQDKARREKDDSSLTEKIRKGLDSLGLTEKLPLSG